MSDDDSQLHEFKHRSGLRVRVPKGFFVGEMGPDADMQLVRGDNHFQFPVAILDDIVAYMKALCWYEVDAMTPASPDWPRFMELLTGKKGINLKPEWENKAMRARGPMTFSCSCSKRPDDWKWDRESDRWPRATAILEKHFPQCDIQDTLAYWMLYKADCDCQVAFNINAVLTEGFSRMVCEMMDKNRRGRADAG